MLLKCISANMLKGSPLMEASPIVSCKSNFRFILLVSILSSIVGCSNGYTGAIPASSVILNKLLRLEKILFLYFLNRYMCSGVIVKLFPTLYRILLRIGLLLSEELRLISCKRKASVVKGYDLICLMTSSRNITNICKREETHSALFSDFFSVSTY